MPIQTCRMWGLSLTCLLFIAGLSGSIIGHTDAEEASERIDRLLAGRYASEAPGSAVLVARKLSEGRDR